MKQLAFLLLSVLMLCDPVEQHPAGAPTAAAPLCGTGGRKALRLLQRGSLQHRKRTDDRGAVSGQAGTSRFEDLILNKAEAPEKEWQRFSLKCCHSFLLSESQMK